MPGGYDYAKFAVVYVDDEEKSLKYFGREFDGEFRVLTCASADAALALFEEKGDSIGILLTDQRMPGMTGVELLDRVRRDWPRVVRVLVTAYSDLESAVDAVNKGEVYRYVSKPWDLRELRILLRRAMEFFLVQLERDALLHEKLTAVQRMLMLDRGRYLLAVATCLRPLLRGANMALRSFLSHLPDQALWDAPTHVPEISPLSDPLALAEDDARSAATRLATVLSSVLGNDTRTPPSAAECADICDIVRDVSTDVGSIDVACADNVPRVNLHRGMFARALGSALRSIAALDSSTGAPSLEVTSTDTGTANDSARVSIRCTGLSLDEAQLVRLAGGIMSRHGAEGAPGLLPLWLATYHHHGTAAFARDDPLGPAVVATLPHNPIAIPAEETFDILGYLTHRAADRHILP